MASDENDIEKSMKSFQLEELRLRNEKLKIELDELRKGKPWYQIPIQFVPLATALVAIAGFWWGLVRYRVDQRQAQAEQNERSRREQVAREREFMKPWLENQRDIYRKALSAAGIVANTENAETRRKAAEEFWSLYHGEMILVETQSVSTAMVNFGNCLNGSKIQCLKPKLDDLAHKLGTAMSESMAATAGMTFEQFSLNQFKYK